jgi:hypothetical protein
VMGATPAIQAAQHATKTIPIVMAFSNDPVESDFVASLARPGSNITGLSLMSPELSGRRLELLKAVSPNISHVAVLWKPHESIQLAATTRDRSCRSRSGVAASTARGARCRRVGQGLFRYDQNPRRRSRCATGHSLPGTPRAARPPCGAKPAPDYVREEGACRGWRSDGVRTQHS